MGRVTNVLARAAAALSALALAACQRPAPPAPATPPPQAQAAAPLVPPPPGEVEPYDLELEPPLAARAGQAATARVHVRAKGGFHVNRDYPMAFRPDPGSVAAFGSERVALGDGAERTPCPGEPAEACAVAAPLRFTVREPGEARLSGTVAFSVCTKELCRIEKVPAELVVTVAR